MISSPPSRRRSSPKKEHPSITALMDEALSGEKPIDVIRRKCRAMVGRACVLGWTGPPFDPEILASVNGILVEETESPLDGEGSLFVRDGKVVIQCLKGIIRERQRFTICHELAHTCFPDAFEFIRRRLKVDEEAHKRFEHLCDVGAGELLMPYREFAARLDNDCPSIPLLQNLAADFLASPDATAKRIVDLTHDSCAAVFLTDDAFDEYREWTNRGRVMWMWKSNSFRGFFPRGTLLPGYSICNDLLKAEIESPAFHRETWYVNNQPRTVYVQPLKLPSVVSHSVYPKVLCLIHDRKPDI